MSMFAIPVVLERAPVGNDNAPLRGGLTPNQLERALRAFREEEARSLDDVARSLNMSRGYFCRAFRTSTGTSPHQWRLRARVERAMELLNEGTASIADVAIACGFADQSHLTRVFVRIVGIGPGAWRRQRGA